MKTKTLNLMRSMITYLFGTCTEERKLEQLERSINQMRAERSKLRQQLQAKANITFITRRTVETRKAA